MHDLHLDHDAQPRPADLAVLQRGLRAYNRSRGLPRDVLPLALFVRDATDTVVAGLWGRSYWGWLYVKWLWVDEQLRGHGWGRKLLVAAEQQARERGCCGVFLDTFSFQAPDFYRRCGYEVFGRLEGLPEGGFREYFCKRLRREEGLNPSPT